MAMLELSFEKFWEHIKQNNKKRNEDYRQLHYMQELRGLFLFLKSIDNWEYYTFVSMDTITSFGASYDATPEMALSDFKMNFLSNALEITNVSDLPQMPPMPVMEEEMSGEEELEPLPEGPIVKEDEKVEKAVEFIQQPEAKAYDDWLMGVMKQWESKVLKAADAELKDETVEKAHIEKTFGEFLTKVFNSITTFAFRSDLRRILRVTFKEGIKDAEKELNLDIGFKADLNAEIRRLADRQIEGFTMDDGGRWNGIKGVSREIQQQITQIVDEGIDERKSLKAIKTDIRNIFQKFMGGPKFVGPTEVEPITEAERRTGKVSEGRVMRIARTEVNRARNEGKIAAMKDAGVKMKR